MVIDRLVMYEVRQKKMLIVLLLLVDRLDKYMKVC